MHLEVRVGVVVVYGIRHGIRSSGVCDDCPNYVYSLIRMTSVVLKDVNKSLEILCRVHYH